MTADDESGQDRSSDENYGGFVFSEENKGSTGGSALPSLEQRLAPIVALLVIVSLLLTGSYIVFATLSGPSEDVLGSAGGSGDPSASNVSSGSTTPPSSTDTVTTPASNTGAAETTAPGTTDAPTTVTPTATETPTDTTTATPTTTDTIESTPTPTTTTPTPTTTTATDTPTATDATAMATATPESRSPSIDTLSADREEGDGSTALTVDWAVSDPDGDLEAVVITVVGPDDGGDVVARRTIEVGGSDASSETVFEIDEAPSGSTYEIRLEAADDAGNVALAVTRSTSDE